MMMRFLPSLPLGLLLLLPYVGQAAQQEISLRDEAAVNDRAYVSSESDMDVQLRVKTPDGELPPLRTTYRRVEQYTERVLAVEVDEPTAVRRFYQLVRTAGRTGAGPLEVSKDPLTGAQIVLRRLASVTSLQVEKGRLSPELQEELRGEWTSDQFTFFPEHAVSPGEEWSPQEATDGSQKGVLIRNMKARLLEVTDLRGHRVARIAVRGDMEFSDPGGEGQPARPQGETAQEQKKPYTVNVSGDYYHALDINRPLSAHVSGPVELEEQIQEGDTTFTARGAGSFRFKIDYTWLEVAGRAIRATAPAGAGVKPAAAKRKPATRRRRSYTRRRR